MKDIDIVKNQLNKAKELLKELPVEQGELIHDYVDYALKLVKKHDFIADVSNSPFNYNAMKEQTNGKVAIRKGCLNQQCFCTGACQEIIEWRDKLPSEH